MASKKIVASALLLAMLIVVCIVCIVGVTTVAEEKDSGENNLGKVVILMYHNILPNNFSGQKYSILQKDLKKDFDFLAKNEYNVISFERLLESVQNKNPLPPKSVILTFDDGYYNNLIYGLPLLEKYNFSALFSVVGEYTAYGKTSCEKMHEYMYLEWEDMAKYKSNKNLEWGLHSNRFHSAEKRLGAKIISGESVTAYRKIFVKDTQVLQKNLLEKCDIDSKIYTYPFGFYCKESEQILKEMGIQITLSCREGVNVIKGKESLYLLKRYNRSGKDTDIKKYLVGLD